MSSTIRLLIADEHPVVRQGLKTLLVEAGDIHIVAEVSNAPDMIQAVRLHRPDIVLLDLCVRRHQIAEAVDAIRQEDSRVRFLIFTTFRGPDEIALALKSKMHGFILKTDVPADIVHAIRAVHQGRRWLSPALVLELGNPSATLSLTEREREVLAVIAAGKSNQEAAETLFISEGTIKFHVNNILNKLGADDRTEAVVIGLHRGLLRLSEPYQNVSD